jgi:hypothetical protein
MRRLISEITAHLTMLTYIQVYNLSVQNRVGLQARGGNAMDMEHWRRCLVYSANYVVATFGWRRASYKK